MSKVSSSTGEALPPSEPPAEEEPASAGPAGPDGRPAHAEDRPDASTEPRGNGKPDSGTASSDGGSGTEADKAKVDEAKVDEAENDKITDGSTAGDDGGAAEVEPEGPDRWASFAPVPRAAPGRVRVIAGRVAGGIGRFLVHEWTIAAVASVALAVLMTWPTLRSPATTIPQDIWDPTLQAWQMAWSGHALTTDPANLWHSNAFYPERYSFVFSDTLLGYAPAGMIGAGPTAAIVRYNIIFVLIFALAFFGAYALARQLGGGRTGAAVAGAAFAYAPWRLGQAGHLHVISVGGIALALAMLARGHGYSLRHGYQPDKRRWGWVLAGWLVAAWQISLGFGIGVPFAYVLLGIVITSAAIWAYRRGQVWAVARPFGWKLMLANIGGGLAFAGVGALMAYPYLRVVELHPYARRSQAALSLFSPPLEGFFIPPPESRLWHDAYAEPLAGLSFPAEMAVLPGFFLYGLAFAGLFVSVWSRRQRLLLGLAVVLSIMLGMGTHGPANGRLGYLLLYQALPGFDGIRTPGRLVLWTTLLLSLLAAGAVSGLVVRAVEARAERYDTAGRSVIGFWARVATLVPLVLVLAEGWSLTPHPVVPVSPIAMHTIEEPMILLPTGVLEDMNTMLWSTDGFPRMINGGSGFAPHRQEDLRAVMQRFPDSESVQALRDLDVKSVVVVRGLAEGTAYQNAIDAPIDGLGLTRTESGDVVIYKLDD